MPEEYYYIVTEDGNRIVTEEGAGNYLVEEEVDVTSSLAENPPDTDSSSAVDEVEGDGDCGDFVGKFNKVNVLSRIHMCDDYDDLVCLKEEFETMPFDVFEAGDYSLAKDHIMRELNKKASSFGQDVFYSPTDSGFRPNNPSDWV